MQERQPDYYAILNLPPESSIDAVKEQFRRLAKVFHPDRNSGDAWFEQQLKLVNEAHAFLSDPVCKAEYDKRRGRRSSDGLAFDGPFEPAPVQSGSTDSPSWSFESNAASSAETSPAPDPTDFLGWGTLIDRPQAPEPLARQVLSTGKELRSNIGRFAIGLAALGLIVAVIVVVNAPQLLPGAAMVSTDAGSGSDNRHMSVQPAPRPVVSSSNEPGITAADIKRADVERHNEAASLHEMVEPYWSRFERIQPKVTAAIAAGRSELSSMEATDGRDAANIPKLGTPRFRSESRLSSDIDELQYKVNDIQARFDDLQYNTTDEDVLPALSDLDRTIGSIERSQDPLFSDLPATGQNAAKHLGALGN